MVVSRSLPQAVALDEDFSSKAGADCEAGMLRFRPWLL